MRNTTIEGTTEYVDLGFVSSLLGAVTDHFSASLLLQRPAQKSRPAAVPADDQDIADKEGHFIVRPGTEIFGCERLS